MSRSQSWWERVDIASLKVSVPSLFKKLEDSGADKKEILHNLITHPQFSLEDAIHLIENHLPLLKSSSMFSQLVFLARLPDERAANLASEFKVDITSAYAIEIIEEQKKFYTQLKILEEKNRNQDPKKLSHWIGLQGIFSQASGNRVLRRDYWPEKLSHGGMMPSSNHLDEDSVKAMAYVWVNSDVNSPFYAWINEMNKSVNMRAFGTRVLYLSDPEREVCLSHFDKEGKLCEISDSKLNKTSIFVIDKDENIFFPNSDVIQIRVFPEYLDTLKKMLAEIKTILSLSDEWIDDQLNDMTPKNSKEILGKVYSEIEKKLQEIQLPVDTFYPKIESYVMKLEFLNLGGQYHWHHSSLLSGQPVLFAGEITVSNGIIESISPASGHYRPTDKNLANCLSVLEKNGVDLNNVSIRSDDGINIIAHNAKQRLTDFDVTAAHEQPRTRLF